MVEDFTKRIYRSHSGPSFGLAPIETPAMQELQPFARARRGASRTIRKLGEATRGLPPEMQVSPAKVEALLRGYFNTWAAYGLMLSDAMLFDDMPDLRTDQYPGARRFYAREPARRSRAVTELYKAAEAATQVRRTMRHMDKAYRPDLADELEYTRENLLHDQLSRARERLGLIKRKEDQVTWAPTLEEVRALAAERARETKSRALINRAKREGAWDNIGALKLLLRDDLLRERNAYAKDVMRDVETRRKEAAK